MLISALQQVCVQQLTQGRRIDLGCILQSCNDYIYLVGSCFVYILNDLKDIHKKKEKQVPKC